VAWLYVILNLRAIWYTDLPLLYSFFILFDRLIPIRCLLSMFFSILSLFFSSFFIALAYLGWLARYIALCSSFVSMVVGVLGC